LYRAFSWGELIYGFIRKERNSDNFPPELRISLSADPDVYIIAGVAAVYFGVVLSRSAYNM
jgi:hypothetical protein